LIRLFTTSFFEPRPERRREYQEAFRLNSNNPAIGEICLLAESDDVDQGRRTVVRAIRRRPTYADYFEWINDVAGADDISIVANADIYFDSTIAAAERGLPDSRTAFALARWDMDSSGVFRVRNRNDSQDSWVFRGKVRRVTADFPIGVPRCDNRIAAELEIAGYTVRNPSFSIRSYHLHTAERTDYPTGQRDGYVDPPYRYLWPENLLPLPATLRHNLRAPGPRLPWMFDSRLVSQRLKLHWLKRILGGA
jgi:hypothetical protein